MKFEELQEKIFEVYYPGKHIIDSGYKYLYDAVSRTPMESVVEIGILMGFGSIILCAAAEERGLKYYGIDPWDLIDSGDHAPLKHFVGAHVNTEKIARRVMAELKFNNYELIKGFSYDAAKDFNEPIGMLFIDGCHCYECVKKDFLLWSPKIIKDGLIIFHDAGFDGVGKVIEGIAKRDPNFIEIRNVPIETYKKIS